MKNSFGIFLLLMCMVLFACVKKEDPYLWKSLQVTATAYNSVASQTDDNPSIAAWGDSLNTEIPSIAVSRNLLALGIKHNTPVKIEGFEGVFLVKDKMHRRWLNRIDIYMGKDVQKAKEWGKKKLSIQYGILKDSLKVEMEAK